MELPEEQQSNIVEKAKTILEDLLDLIGLQAAVVTSTESLTGSNDDASSSITLDVKGDDLGILIGRRGQTLASLQYLVRLMVSQQTQTKLPIIIDIEGYKRHRWEALRALAVRMAEHVRVRQVPFALEPMPAFERRIVHLALADHPDVTTESTGEGETRKVVILPKKHFNA